MTTVSLHENPEPRRRVELLDLRPTLADFRADVLEGLSAPQRTIPPKYFYDARGSRLFDAITTLPEYYPTRTEITILRSRMDELAEILGDPFELVEFGSGSSTKTRILLEAASDARGSYLPVDISREHLLAAAGDLAAKWPDLRVVAVCADYTQPMPLERLTGEGRRTLFFPGSTIGNFNRAEAVAFLKNARTLLREGDRMLVGADLQKDERILHAAYNDAAGITAEFNLNLLARVNRELGGTFDLERWEHLAFYDGERGRIEMHLRSRGAQRVSVGSRSFRFGDGETIHTENSWKYTFEGFAGLAADGGFATDRVWTDPARLFSVHVLRAES